MEWSILKIPFFVPTSATSGIASIGHGRHYASMPRRGLDGEAKSGAPMRSSTPKEYRHRTAAP